MKKYLTYTAIGAVLLAAAGGAVLTLAVQHAGVLAWGVNWYCQQDEGKRLELRAAVARELEARGQLHTARIECNG